MASRLSNIPSESHGEDESSSPLDFISAVTTISTIYSRGRYLNFDDVDGNPREREQSLLGQGSVFVAYKREIQQKVPSQTRIGQYDTKCTPVVFKKPKTLFDASGQCMLPEDVAGFLMEARILSHRPLYWHPNIITLMGISWYFDLFVRTPAVQPQLVLEVADQSLDNLLKSSTDIPFQTRIRISLDITNGLSAIHACGIIHGDIKPANILLCHASTGPDSTFTAKIADFSHSWVSKNVPCRRLVGSPNYRAPEIVRRETIVDFRPADIYSLGATLWRVLVRDAEIPASIPSGGTLQGASSYDPYLASILGELRRYLQQDANEGRWPFLRNIFRASLSLVPESRRLDSIQQEILLILRTGQDALDSEELAAIMGLVNSIPPSPLPNQLPQKIVINYQLFQRARGPVHDQMMEALYRISHDPNDVRRPRALYELGICNIAGLGDPKNSDYKAALLMIHKAAEQGETTARAYIRRLLKTFAKGVNGQRVLLPELRVPVEWVAEAAVAGYEVAFQEYTDGGVYRKGKEWVLYRRASYRFCSPLTVLDVSHFRQLIDEIPGTQWKERMITNQVRDTVLHWAAYCNLEDHLRHILDYEDVVREINAQNDYGDTPLITACSVGNLEAALCLMQAGADVNIVNTRNESCLHHLWRFTDDKGSIILHELVERGIDWEIETDPHRLPEAVAASSPEDDHTLSMVELDPLPVLPGKAIQRLAGRGRTVLLQEFLLLAPPSEPRDGNLVRQMIRWASTLSFPDTREALIKYARGQRPTNDPGNLDDEWYSVPVEDTTFEMGGLQKGFMDAVAQGWQSTRRDGWRTPDIWWRICCHGPSWHERLRSTMDSIIWSSSKALCCYEDTLLFALQIHSSNFTRLFLRTYTNTKLASRIRDRDRVTCTCKRGASTALDTRRKIRLQPMVRPIDKIFYKDGRSLLHLTIIMGLRQAFLDILHEFNADVERLVESSSSSDYPSHSLNCYSLVAMYSKDSWFMNALLEAGLDYHYSGPLQSLFSWTVVTPFSPWFNSYYLFIPPLLHAFDHGYHFLVRFLLDNGAKIDEEITPYSTVFDYILSPALINRATLRFLFSKNGLYSGEDGAMKQISPSLLPQRLFKEGNGLRIFQLICEQQQLRSDETLSVFHQFRRAHLCQYPFDLYMNCLWKSGAHLLSPAVVLPFNILYLPILYHTSQSPVPWHQFRQAKQWARVMLSKPLGRHPGASDEAARDETYFIDIWNELLRIFPNTQVTPLWYREGYSFYRSRSLLAMALIGNKNTDFGPWLMSTPTICHHSRWSEEAEKKWSQPNSIAQATTKLYEKTIPSHQPSLVNFFFYDDYDFLPSDSEIARTLYEMGHRHSLLYFHEVRIILILIALAVPFLVYTMIVLRRITVTVAGVILFYPSLVLSLFERPYLHLVPLNLFMLVGWPFASRPFIQITLLVLYWLGYVFSFIFLCGLANRMLQTGQLRSTDRFLCNALLPQFEYTGYSPLRLFRRPKNREFPLENRTQAAV
ncbi:uncharacterized protein LDX57_008471 [Aspergillus melleus]|uniref:uncharacterized protein n=1 Tax=Aspergillus melleus TaxID=138277 RepID=UPI001E8DA031|nr:uncharacterized protein LDX57_008471 [Aspergillus melleus]KAH8430809.1 hypothetical protein LDX57_008471 [Aspergillus melleus]